MNPILKIFSYQYRLSISLVPFFQIKIPNATYHSFFTLLEYLYSDHAPIEQGDPVEVLVLANQYCIPRLVTLAEYCIAKTIEETLSRKTSLEGDMNIFNVMYNSKVGFALKIIFRMINDAIASIMALRIITR